MTNTQDTVSERERLDWSFLRKWLGNVVDDAYHASGYEAESAMLDAKAAWLEKRIAPVPVSEPVGMGEFEGLVDAFKDAVLDTADDRVPGVGKEIDAARTALLDAYRRGGAVGGDEALELAKWLLSDAAYLREEIARAEKDAAPLDAFRKMPRENGIAERLERAAHVLSRPSGSGDELWKALEDGDGA